MPVLKGRELLDFGVGMYYVFYDCCYFGSSHKEHRFSFKAMKALEEHGSEIVLVHPILKDVEGRRVLSSMLDIQGEVDAVTVYVNPAISMTLTDEFLKLAPKRVIFNPGTENPILESQFEAAGINVVNYCTLILLS